MPAPAASSPPPRTHAERRAMLATMRTDTLQRIENAVLSLFSQRDFHEVSLIDVVDDGIAVLKFGGGCQGCGQADVTLKEGIEKTLLERIPELKGVRDVTDHSIKENAYY